MSDHKKSEEQRARELREALAIQEARITKKPLSYIDTDGCEVTITPSGHSFYNVGDWW